MSLFRNSTLALAVAGAVLAGGTATAAGFASDAYGTRVHVGALDTISADAVAGASAGATPGAYDRTGTVASVGQSAQLSVAGLTGIYDRLNSGVIATRATSDGTSTASATVTVANPTLALGTGTTILGGADFLSLLGIAADAVTSTSTVTIGAAGPVATGASTITNLRFTGLVAPLASLSGALLAQPAANTVLSLGSALTLTLNEQLTTNTAGLFGLQTNALHLALNGYQLGGQTLTGDFVIGHSAAQVAGAVPEPAAWATMVAGFGLLGGALRRRRAPRLAVA